MYNTNFEHISLQLAQANRLVRLCNFRSWEGFVVLDRYRQDLEHEIRILENEEASSMFGKTVR